MDGYGVGSIRVLYRAPENLTSLEVGFFLRDISIKKALLAARVSAPAGAPFCPKRQNLPWRLFADPAR